MLMLTDLQVAISWSRQDSAGKLCFRLQAGFRSALQISPSPWARGYILIVNESTRDKINRASPFKASTHITSYHPPLVEGSHMAKPKVSRTGEWHLL